MKYLGLIVLLCATLADAATYTVTTKISKIRTVSEFHPVSAARHHVPFQIEAPLQAGCIWLYITPEAKDAYSLLLAAKLADREVGILYSDASSPWSGKTCQVHHVDLD